MEKYFKKLVKNYFTGVSIPSSSLFLIDLGSAPA